MIVDLAAPSDPGTNRLAWVTAVNKATQNGNEPGLLRLPAGVWVMAKDPAGQRCITGANNLEVAGASLGRTVLKADTVPRGVSVLDCNGTSGMTVRDLTVDGNITANPPDNNQRHSIVARDTTGFLADRCEFRGQDGDGVYLGRKTVGGVTSGAVIRRCGFRDLDRNGITMGSMVDGVTIDACEFSSTVRVQPIDSEPTGTDHCDNVTVTRCVIEGNPSSTYGLTVTGGSVHSTGWEVTDCFIGGAVLILRSSDVRVTGCEIRGIPQTKPTTMTPAVHVYYDNDDIQISDCDLWASSGAAVLAQSVNDARTGTLDVTGNRMWVFGVPGVRADGVHNTRIWGNSIEGDGTNPAVTSRIVRDMDLLSVRHNMADNVTAMLKVTPNLDYRLAQLVTAGNTGGAIDYSAAQTKIDAIENM